MRDGLPVFQGRWVKGEGVRLWAATASMEGEATGEVLLTHGLGEHAGRYEPMARRLSAAGLRLHVYDLRGHGLSEGRRGDAAVYPALLEDFEKVRLALVPQGRPLFLMGHSFGGQLTLNAVLAGRVECRGVVVASPLLRLAFAPARWRLALGHLAMRLLPGWSQRRAIAPEHLSRDAEHLRSLPGPELLHDLISARLFFAQQREGERLLARAGEWCTPLFLLHGAADAITSLEATREFFARAASLDKRLLVVPEGRHELHNDLGREELLNEIVRWMRERC